MEQMEHQHYIIINIKNEARKIEAKETKKADKEEVNK